MIIIWRFIFGKLSSRVYGIDCHSLPHTAMWGYWEDAAFGSGTDHDFPHTAMWGYWENAAFGSGADHDFPHTAMWGYWEDAAFGSCTAITYL